MKRLAVVFAFVALAGSAGAAGQPPRDYGPVFSPDGKTIAFERLVGTSASLMLVGSDGRNLRQLARVSAQYLAWSPDGQSLAYASGRNIWRVDVATGATEQLTHDPGSGTDEDWQPSWSPDGSTIAWDRFERCFRCTGVWLMNADGTDQREIFQDGRRPTWSPDGSRLALSLADAALVIDADGRVVVPGGGAYTAWSPRGTYVVYTGDGLEIQNVATGASRRLTRLIQAKPAWSRDGSTIAGETSRLRVALVRAKTGRLVEIFAASNTAGGGPTWSPQGLVAFSHADECGIDVAREDGTHLRRLTKLC